MMSERIFNEIEITDKTYDILINMLDMFNPIYDIFMYFEHGEMFEWIYIETFKIKQIDFNFIQ